MTWFKKIVVLVFVILILIQFIQPSRNNSRPVSAVNFEKIYQVPGNVSSMLKASCYDCHSNNTSYPWYSNIQPGAWWMSSHIKRGKAELNFDEFGNYSALRRRNKLQAVINSINDGTMPLASYTIMHQNARLSSEDKKTLLDWLAAKKDSQ
ncbi:MAG: heme-binding domain-containing protein [Ferruginibacter sp.]